MSYFFYISDIVWPYLFWYIPNNQIQKPILQYVYFIIKKTWLLLLYIYIWGNLKICFCIYIWFPDVEKGMSRRTLKSNKKMSYKDEMSEADSWAKSWILWVVALIFVIGGITWFFNRAEKTAETAIIRYEEFQDIYNTCKKLDNDICIISDGPSESGGFAKSDRINSVKMNLNRWIEQYNADSRKWTRSMWKSKDLPYELSLDEFSCYSQTKNQKTK